MEFTDFKAPGPVEGIPPWQDPQWLAEAEDWINAECARAWSLTRDGGPTLSRTRRRITDTGDWHAMLGAYAQLQLDLARHVGDLLALGLADLRPGSVPGQFAKLLDDPATEQRGTR